MLIIREMQINTALRSCLSPVRLAKLKGGLITHQVGEGGGQEVVRHPALGAQADTLLLEEYLSKLCTLCPGDATTRNVSYQELARMRNGKCAKSSYLLSPEHMPGVALHASLGLTHLVNAMGSDRCCRCPHF